MPEADLLKDSIEVNVKGQTYEFRVPSYMDEIKLGVRERNIRQDIEKEIGETITSGSADGIDNGTYFMVRVAAQFEVLLKKSSTRWPWTNDDKGNPIVNYKKWPNDKVNEAIEVGVAFGAELARFRDGGLSNGDGSGTEVMEGEPDPRAITVRSSDPQSS